ncbi:PREDICTED: protein DMR6-LIKE OXYGENASE 2-like isoform X2 [Ipomoea nil]|uniref:protein DMR6-LIKE OXYGENASE 2-like isoform X2 n=1 Tax=Ipomoea nil TaxID=35883 RepID=UPI00090187D8|nr:PREDICTED: protein DMR6-LIKE OXYGENASE 2-like isoform X2 [Ipomoea nil]
MATPAMLPPQNSAVAPASHSSATVKVLSESPDLNSIPSNYVHSSSYEESPDSSDAEDSSLIPVIDFSQLTSNDNDQKSKAIQVLGKACEEWGFFMVVNHGIPDSLMKAVINVSNEFFNMPEEDKKQFEGKHLLDPIRCGTSFNSSKEKAFFWRDFLKVVVHPEFHCPSDPQGFSDLMLEYSENCRKVVKKLLGAISESLDLDECVINEAMGLDSMLQKFNVNYYPRCPQPELAIGLPPHSDHGLLTLLIHNEVGGLQIMHKGKWINDNWSALPNSLLVNIGDQLEIFSNGKYKSVLHRAMVNNEMTRISVALTHGPSLEAIVRPASPLVQRTGCCPAYSPMTYKDYLYLQQSNHLDGKSCLDHVVNHGIPESLINSVIDVSNEFFNMPKEDKKQFEGKHVLDPIRYGASFNYSKEKALFWRDFLKVFVHPEFHFPSDPQALSDLILEYSENCRRVVKKLLGAISESLGLDECFINEALGLDSMFQLFNVNYYPRCPQPELAIGLPPHTDYGLLTLLIHNGVGGLQIMHEGKWINDNRNAFPNSLLVNVCDQLQIFSNGKYKSVSHRAMVNNEMPRISVVVSHGPQLETIVRPASPLVQRTGCCPVYGPMTYKDYIHLKLSGKSCLDHLRIQKS